ncbi:unnamed protein product [Urochloa decumbens]|uniref:Uncharacterized protein n=1 Tax=Urochloa decumbens TaxID=240449 RepID=A0ABC9GEM7_9POAL
MNLCRPRRTRLEVMPWVEEDGDRGLVFDEVQRSSTIPESVEPETNGPAHVTKTLKPMSCPTTASSPMQEIPLDDPVLSALGFSPAIHAQPAACRSAVAGACPSPLKTYYRRGKCPLASSVVEAAGAPPPDSDPARVAAASMPPPVTPPAAVEANSGPTGVVEVDLAPLPDRPACVDAMNAPPPVAQDEPVLIPQEPVVDIPAASKTSTFIAKISKPIQEVLQCPPPPRKRKKTLPDDFIPRRSRRVAKLPPISDHKSAESVCRQLCFKNGEDDTPEHEEAISEETLAQYVRIFEQKLSQEHIKALAALFGWNAPSEAECRVPPAVRHERAGGTVAQHLHLRRL